MVKYHCLWLEAPLLEYQARCLGWHICGVQIGRQFFFSFDAWIVGWSIDLSCDLWGNWSPPYPDHCSVGTVA
jgi:hypothetical protein